VVKTDFASSNLRVESNRPGRAIKVSLPQSANQGKPAIIVVLLLGSASPFVWRFVINWSAAKQSVLSFVSPFFYTTLAFATLYDVILFNVIPDAISWAGAALILISAAILAWRETRR